MSIRKGAALLPLPLLTFLCLTLGGCAAVPEALEVPLQGPKAVLSDSALQSGGSRGHLFYLIKRDGMAVANTGTATARATHGKGAELHTVRVSREVAAGPQTLTLKGHTVNAMPIQAMFAKHCVVEGDVRVDLLPDKRYVVRGLLNAASCAVWIEEEGGGELPGSRVTAAGLK